MNERVAPERFTMLLLDDEEAVLKAMYRDMRDMGFQVVAFTEPRRALAFLKKLSADGVFDEGLVHRTNVETPGAVRAVDVMISDVRMPEMDGVEFLSEARELFPDSIRYILTGYADAGHAIGAVNRAGAHYYFTKPWSPDEIRAQLARGLELYEARRERAKLARVNVRNLRAFQDDVVRISNDFKEGLVGFAERSLESQRTQVRNLTERVNLVAGQDMYYVLAPIRDAIAEGVARTGDFVGFLDARHRRSLTHLINCLNFLQQIIDPAAAPATETFEYGDVVSAALRERASDLNAKGVQWDTGLAGALGRVHGSREMLTEAWGLLMAVTADVVPPQGRLYIHLVQQLPEVPGRSDASDPGRLGHSELAGLTSASHVIVSIKGDIGVPESEFLSSVGGVGAKMIEETMRFHDGAAVFANR
ncbi:MAG: response regulator, partial [Candidatus Methylomirabilis sp.]|nr:response regulator [Deltaproteobacteria bacterium]